MVKVLFDHNMPPAIARGLHELIKVEGHEAHALRDLFSPTIDDVSFFRQLSGRDWVVISKDTRNARIKTERAAILESGVLAFYLRPSLQKMRLHEQAAIIFWHWDNIVQQRRLNERGLFLLPENKGSRFSPL